MLSQQNIKSIISTLSESFYKDIYRSGEFTIYTGDYIFYIVQILFFKWLLDSHDKDIVIEDNIVEYFFIPDCIKWKNINKLDDKIGEKLIEIFSSIEQNNFMLRGVFINPVTQWEKIDDRILKEIFNKISSSNLNIQELHKMNLIEEIYQYWMIHSNGKDSGLNYLVPNCLRTLAIKLVQPKIGMRIYDPTCRAGEILIEAIHYLKKRGSSLDSVRFFGQEKNDKLRSIAIINLILHGINNFEISPNNIIEELPMNKTGNLQKFDIVVTNPPFGISNWKKKDFNSSYDFEYGEPPKRSADYAFIQRVLSILEKTGKAAIIVPHGVLFRGGVEGKIRKNIIEHNLIEAIIGLPQNLFPYTGIAIAMILFNKKKLEYRQNKILFIDASNEYKKSKNFKPNFLTEDHISRIFSTYSEFQEEAGYSRIVSHDEIFKSDSILTVSYYIEPTKVKAELDIDAQIKKIKELETERNKIETQMNACLKELGLDI